MAVYMLNRSNIVLSNVIVDGNQPNLGPAAGRALIEAGGFGSGEVIRDIKALESRSWTTIQLFDPVAGGISQCTNPVVENNEIRSAFGGGIAVACLAASCGTTDYRHRAVGIMIFGAPGSLVEGNVLRAETRGMFSGINMVDYGFDYNGTRVHANVIDAAAAHSRRCGDGYRIWYCVDPNDPTDYTFFGATVTDNILRGAHMQYGFAIDGVRDWTVTGNQDFATHSGTPMAICNGKFPPPRGLPDPPGEVAGDVPVPVRRGDP